MKKKLRENKGKELYRILCSIMLIVVIGLLNTKNCKLPFVFHDEFGYWGNAALVAGYDWSGIVSEIGWYAYGYSLILGLLIKVFADTLLAYRAAIFLNIVLLVCSFIILYFISKRLTDKHNIEISLLVILYPSNIANKNYAWPEILLFFLFCFLTFSMIKIYETQKTRWVITSSLIVVYMYMVHMRTIGILLISLLFTIYTIRKNRKQIVLTILIIIFGIVLQMVLKEYFVSNLWKASEASNYNGYTSVLKPNGQSLWTSIIKIIYVAIGNAYYLMVSTFGLSIYFIYFTFKNITKEKNVKTHIIIYLFLAYFTNLLVVSIAGRNPQYTTHLLYGRYSENLIGPILIVTLSLIQAEKLKIKSIISIYFIIGVITIILLNAEKVLGIYQLNVAINNIGISYLYDNNAFQLFLGTKVFLLSLLSVYLIFKYCKHKKVLIMPLTLWIMVWIFIGNNAFNTFEDEVGTYIKKDIAMNFSEQIENDSQARNLDIYIKNEGMNLKYAEVLQFLLPTNKIKIVNDLNRINNEGRYIIIDIQYGELDQSISFNYMIRGKN